MSTQGRDTDRGPAPAWTAGTVARRLGVAQSTLRSWNRRYGLGPEGHQPGRYRHYTEADIAVLETMRKLVADGVPPSAAAASARVRRYERNGAGRGAAPRARRSVTGLETAALRLDAAAVMHSLEVSLASEGVLQTWRRLCRPVLMRFGRRVTDSGDCIDVVLMLSWAISTSLHRDRDPGPPAMDHSVLLACTAGEQHSLGLEVLRAALTEQGIPARMLGTSVPTPALSDAVARAHPAVVVLSSQTARTASSTALRRVRDGADCVIAAGPGWTSTRPPAGVVRGGTIEQVLDTARWAAELHAVRR